MYENREFPWLTRLSKHFRVLAYLGAIVAAVAGVIGAFSVGSQSGDLAGFAVMLYGLVVAYFWFALNMLISEAIGLALRIEANTRSTSRALREVQEDAA